MPYSRSHNEGVIEPGYNELSQSDSRICVILSYARLFSGKMNPFSGLYLPHLKIAMGDIRLMEIATGDIRLMESCCDP